jgi:hypothetical protein
MSCAFLAVVLATVHTSAGLRSVRTDSACVDAVEAKGASGAGAVACCDMVAASFAQFPFPVPPRILVQSASQSYEDGVCGGPLGQTGETVQMLNSRYASYDPEDASSSLGVGLHLTDSETTLMNETWNMPCDKCLSTSFSNGVCSVAISLLNRAVSKLEPDWKGQELVSHLGLNVCVYPGVTKGGVVYTPEAVDAATTCAYGVDAYSTKRPNRGCGCLQEGFQCLTFPDGTTSGGFPEETQDLVTSCKCKSIDQNPSLDNAVGDASCFWEGERLRQGAGQSGIRSAVAQQYKFRKSNKKCWNELLLDAQVTNKLMREDAAKTIAAYVIPVPLCLMQAECRNQVVATRDFVTKEFGLQSPIPIVGFNYLDADEPFIRLDARFS